MANWKWFGKTHACIFKLSGGRFGKRMGGIDIVMIETIGRKTGKTRVVPVACYPYKDSVLAVASNNGLEVDPVWWLNLKGNPEVFIQKGLERYKARAIELQGDDREKAWPGIVKINPRQKHYAKIAGRVLPVIYFERL